MENGVPKKMEGVIHYRVEYLDEYKRCLVLFMIEAFQFIQKDTYNLQIPSYSISQEMKVRNLSNSENFLLCVLK